MADDKNKPSPGRSLVGVAQECEKTAADLKSVSDALSSLLKTVTVLQNSASETHSRAENNLKSIQANTEDIAATKGTVSVLQENQENQGKGLDECFTRIEALERNQEMFRKIDDQDLKISQLERRISPSELIKGSCIITLHGLPLPKKISDMDISDPQDVNIVANALMEGLGKAVAEYIFASDGEGGFANMAGWARIPDNDSFKYSTSTPEASRNSVIFYFKNRVQTIHFESKMRGSLIATQMKRRSGDFGFLEMAIYAESPRVRALKNMLLFKGKMLVDFLPQFSHYRVAWRGGANKSTQAPAKLVLEIKASKEQMEVNRKDYFFNGEGKLIRNAWTEQTNIKISEPEQAWFSRKPEINQRVESQLTSNTTPKTRQANKRSRDSPGLAGNMAKMAGQFKCKSCDRSFRSKVGLDEHFKEEHALEQIPSEEEGGSDEEADERDKEKDVRGDEEEAKDDDATLVGEEESTKQQASVDLSGFSPPNTKKEKKLAAKKNKLGIKGSGSQKTATSFSLHAPVPDLQKQRKITSSFSSISKKPGTSSTPSIPNAMPVPNIFNLGE